MHKCNKRQGAKGLVKQELEKEGHRQKEVWRERGTEFLLCLGVQVVVLCGVLDFKVFYYPCYIIL